MGSSPTFVVNFFGGMDASANTEDWLVIITPPAGITLSIKKIRFTDNQGSSTTTSDRTLIIRFKSLSAVPAGGSALTPVKTDGSSPAVQSTVKHTYGVATGGTTTATFNVIALWRQTLFEWSARDKDDEMTLKPGEMFGVTGASNLAGDAYVLNVVWSESG